MLNLLPKKKIYLCLILTSIYFLHFYTFFWISRFKSLFFLKFSYQKFFQTQLVSENFEKNKYFCYLNLQKPKKTKRNERNWLQILQLISITVIDVNYFSLFSSYFLCCAYACEWLCLQQKNLHVSLQKPKYQINSHSRKYFNYKQEKKSVTEKFKKTRKNLSQHWVFLFHFFLLSFRGDLIENINLVFVYYLLKKKKKTKFCNSIN